MKNEQIRLLEYKNKINNILSTAPKGRLGIRKERGKIRFYHILGAPSSKIIEYYIPTSNLTLAKSLAQKDYYIKTLKLIEKRLKDIDRIINLSKNSDIMQVYDELSPARKELVTPIEPTWEERVNNWYQIPYEKMPTKYDTPDIITKNGENVKSKTEKFMADFFFDKSIKYKYEKPLYLKGYGKVHPDFSLLSPYTFEEVYWEHFGMVDKPEYTLNMVQKINAYQRNGYILGKNLIVTFETSKEVLNPDILEKLINEYFIKSDID